MNMHMYIWKKIKTKWTNNQQTIFPPVWYAAFDLATGKSTSVYFIELDMAPKLKFSSWKSQLIIEENKNGCILTNKESLGEKLCFWIIRMALVACITAHPWTWHLCFTCTSKNYIDVCQV